MLTTDYRSGGAGLWASAGPALGGKIGATGSYTPTTKGYGLIGSQINVGGALPAIDVPMNIAAGTSNTLSYTIFMVINKKYIYGIGAILIISILIASQYFARERGEKYFKEFDKAKIDAVLMIDAYIFDKGSGIKLTDGSEYVFLSTY